VLRSLLATALLVTILRGWAWCDAHPLPRNNSLIAVTADGKRLLCANPDSGSVTVVDTGARQALFELPVGRNPQGVAVVPNSRFAVATVYDEDVLVVLDWVAGRVEARIRVPDEPYGVVVSRDGKLAYVSHDYPGAVSVVDLNRRTLVKTWKVGRFVRGVAISPDDRWLYATEFYTAELLKIDTASGSVVDRWTAVPKYNLARNVVLNPVRAKAYIPHVRSDVDIIDADRSIAPILSVVDLDRVKGKRRKPISLDTYNGFFAVANPWEAAVSPDGRMLYIVYAGTDDMHVNRVLDDNYYEIEMARPLVRVGRNPRAVVVDPTGRYAYVYAALDFCVAVFDTHSMEIVDRVTVTTAPYSRRHLLGKILFNSALQPMVARRWISCASCHPDGQPDGRTWHMPEGPRNTPSLAGLWYTHPLHWSADRDEVQDFEHTIRGPLMRGCGLIQGKPNPPLGAPNAGRSEALDALAEYCNSIGFTLSPYARGGKLSEKAVKGRELFYRADVGCATCHSGPYYTDQKMHDVGTGRDDPSEKLGPAFDTPTLLGVYRTAPYLHHGKARTLRDVLTTYNREDRHGRTSHLSDDEIDALVEFLKSLPYELPPELEGDRTRPAPYTPDEARGTEPQAIRSRR